VEKTLPIPRNSPINHGLLSQVIRLSINGFHDITHGNSRKFSPDSTDWQDELKSSFYIDIFPLCGDVRRTKAGLNSYEFALVFERRMKSEIQLTV